jgi:hypothetical protein
MEKTRVVVAVAGALMLLGGVMQLFIVLRLRGRAPWRGPAVSATAPTVYGLVALSGLVVNGGALGAVLTWAIVMAMWFGLWLSRRDRAQPVQ